MPWSPDEIAARVAREFSAGQVVSLCGGMPLLVVAAVDESMQVMLHSESGVLGMGLKPQHGRELREVVDPEGRSVGMMPGGSFFDAAQGSMMARGGHIDVCVTGALEVDERGNLANWTVPGKFIRGPGAAMDVVVGAERVIAVMNHVGPSGELKLVSQCSLPLSAVERVDTVVTDLGVFAVEGGCFRCVELAPNTVWEDVEAATEGRLIRSEQSGKPHAGPAPAGRPPGDYDDEQGELVAESDWGSE